VIAANAAWQFRQDGQPIDFQLLLPLIALGVCIILFFVKYNLYKVVMLILLAICAISIFYITYTRIEASVYFSVGGDRRSLPYLNFRILLFFIAHWIINHRSLKELWQDFRAGRRGRKPPAAG
jgi:hypothetical protein